MPIFDSSVKQCLVLGCPNTSDKGQFIGDLCVPCCEMVSTGVISPQGDTFIHKIKNQSSLQAWVFDLPIRIQFALMSALRGCDGIPRNEDIRPIQRYLRRCICNSSYYKRPFDDAVENGGGSFMGALERDPPVTEAGMLPKYREQLLPHFYDHIMLAIEIVGYYHPDGNIKMFWRETYYKMAQELHLVPESMHHLKARLSDDML